MAPDAPAIVVVHDLRVEGATLRSRTEMVEAIEEGALLRVGWNYSEQPPGYFPLGGGVVFVRDTGGYVRVPPEGLPPIEGAPTALGDSQYRVREVAFAEGAMVVLILPNGTTLVEPRPVPVAAKQFEGRIAVYWRVTAAKGVEAAVIWGLRPLQRELQSEVETINGGATIQRPVAQQASGNLVIEDTRSAGALASAGYTVLGDLQRLVANRQVVAVVGAGVAVRASGGAAVASWTGLLEDGIARCSGLGLATPEWAERRRADLISGEIDELLSVAEQVASRLGAPAGGEYRGWLRDTVGELKVRQPDVLQALNELGVPLATTNYDGLIEEVTGLRPVTWRDSARVERVLRGDEPGVLHLHGYWENPESVVLGIRSYEAVTGDPHAQTVLRAMRLTRSLLFVGFGAGLADPNFGALLRWTRETFASSEYRQFRLAQANEVATLRQQHPLAERIFPLSYGERHDDLAPFLRDLRVRTEESTDESRAPTTLPTADSHARSQTLSASGRAEPTTDSPTGLGALVVVPSFRRIAPTLGDPSEWVCLIVGNYGETTALDVRLRFVDPLLNSENVDLSAQPPISRGIPVLKAGQEESFRVDDFHDLQPRWILRGIRGVYRVDVSAKNPHSGEGETTRHEIDLGTVFPTERVGPWVDAATGRPVSADHDVIRLDVDPHPDNVAADDSKQTTPE